VARFNPAMSELILSDTGEQREIARKRAELKDLETRLAEAEPALATLQTQMRVFETRYLQIIGLRYDELAEIESEIAKLQGLLAHEDRRSTANRSPMTKSVAAKTAFTPTNLKSCTAKSRANFIPIWPTTNTTATIATN
jgi:septal ring factor EnvC (AmiA/AmiB activator)